MEIGFFQADNEDILPIFNLCKALIDEYEDHSSISYPKVLEWVETKIRQSIDTYTVVTLSGVKVGYYHLVKQGDKYELDDFYILPAYRRKGLGTYVLNAICKKTEGSIFLYVFTQNTGAIALYERFGFKWTKTVSPTRQIMERPG